MTFPARRLAFLRLLNHSLAVPDLLLNHLDPFPLRVLQPPCLLQTFQDPTRDLLAGQFPPAIPDCATV